MATLFAITVLLCLGSCRANDVEPLPDEESGATTAPLLFTASAGSESGSESALRNPSEDSEESGRRAVSGTRAGSHTPMQDIYTNFGVYAYKTMDDASTQDVIRYGTTTPYLPYEVVRDDASSSWTYEITSDDREQYLRYWDLAARDYRFEGVAPFRLGTDAVVGAPHNVRIADGKLRIDAVSGNVSMDNAVDWMTASHLRDYSAKPDVADTDLIADAITRYPMALTEPVELCFHHILSQVEIRAYNDEATDLSIASLTMKFMQPNPDFDAEADESPSNPRYIDATIYTSADFTSNPGGTQWTYADASKTNILYSLPTSSSMLVTGDSKETANTLLSLMELPQSVKGKYLSIEIATAQRSFSGIFPLTPAYAIGNPTYGWESGMKYIYYIHLSNNEEVILLSIAMEDFSWKEGNEIGEDENKELNNW